MKKYLVDKNQRELIQVILMSRSPKNMHIVLADTRLVWHVIDYLQRDALSKGAFKCKDDLADSGFFSFWHNMDSFMPAARENRLYVVLDPRRRLLAYFIVRENLGGDHSEGALLVEIFEVLPKYRKLGVGSFMVSWLEDKACIAGFDSLKVLPANGSDDFWNKRGFISWPVEPYGYLLLPIQ